MPLMGGIEMAEAVRGLQRAGQLDTSTKLVLLSGDDLSQDSLVLALFDFVLLKPVTVKELSSILEALYFNH